MVSLSPSALAVAPGESPVITPDTMRPVTLATYGRAGQVYEGGHTQYQSHRLREWTRSSSVAPGGGIAAAVQAAIDANARTLGEAAQRNARRWVSANNFYPDEATFEEDLAIMKRWVQERGEWLDAELQRRADRAR